MRLPLDHNFPEPIVDCLKRVGATSSRMAVLRAVPQVSSSSLPHGQLFRD